MSIEARRAEPAEPARQEPTSPERHEELMEQFDAAADLEPAAQGAFLEALRARDPGLASEVESLLFHDAREGQSLDQAAPHIAMLREAFPAEPRPAIRPEDVPEMGLLVAERYRLEQVLGRGGGGTVCRARDLQTGDEVAVKFLRGEELSNEHNVRRFRREFRAIARLEHPGCVQVYAEGLGHGRRYIVMEYVRGGDLDRLVGAPTDLMLAVLVQVAVALDYVHGKQIVHRDLKPANVLLTPGELPVPKIADFGIALVRDESSRQTDEGAVVGTVDYLSPEQVEGRPADPRSDLYALGCIIYRLWTGHPPFAGNTFLRLGARCTQLPPPLRQLAPEAPAGLEQLASRLLAIDPADRPQGALDVAAALAELLVATGSPRASALLASTSLRAGGAFLYRAGLVGRSAEQGQLIALARSAAAGASDAPSFLALCGEGGVGKTTLTRAVQRELGSFGFRTITAAVPAAAPGPLAPFPELRAALDGPAQAPVARAGHRYSGEGGRHREAEALAARLRDQHATGPLLVVLEDMHHAARDSFEVLADLAQQLAETPGLRPALLVTLRPEARAVLTEAAARRGASIRWVPLDPLDEGGVAAVAAAMLGVRAGQLPRALIELLVVESDGNPLLVQSALRALVDQEALRRRDGRWELEDGQAAAGSAQHTLVGRLALLSASTRRTLEVGAAVGRRFDAELIAAITDEEESAVQDALDEALRAAVIRPARGGELFDAFEFEHIRLAEVLYNGMEPAARAACHAALGRLLEARGAPAAALARHHSLGGDPRAALRGLRVAGEEALQGYDHTSAERLFREALGHAAGLAKAGEGEVEIAACREGLADALVRVDRVPEAVALLVDLLRTADPRPHAAPSTRARQLRKLGFARMHSGDTMGAVAALEGALDALGDRIPRGRVAMFIRIGRDILSAIGHRLLRLRLAGPRDAPLLEEAAVVHRELGQLFRWVDLERSVAHHIASGRAAERLAAPELQVDAIASIALALAFFTDGAASLALERFAHQLALSTGDRVGVARLLVLRAGVDLVVRDERDASLRGLDEGVALMQASGDRMMHAWVLSWRGWAHIFAGHFVASLADFNQAHAIAKELGIDWLVADSACGRCLIDCVRGRIEAAERGARELLASDVRLALPAIEAVCTEVLGSVAMLKGRFRDSVAEFTRAHTIYWEHHLERGWGFLLELQTTEALLCLADRDGLAEVPDLIDRILTNAKVSRKRFGRLPIYRGCAMAIFGIYHARRGDTERARSLFTRALARRPAGRETYMDAWMFWRIAFERRRLGDPLDQILPLITAAEDIFRRVGFDGLILWLTDTRRIYDI